MMSVSSATSPRPKRLQAGGGTGGFQGSRRGLHMVDAGRDHQIGWHSGPLCAIECFNISYRE